MPRRSQNTSQEDPTPSQLQDIEKDVQKCVRYILYATHGDLPVKKSEIVKNVLKANGKSFNSVIKHVERCIKNDYGAKLIQFSSGNVPYYVVVNKPSLDDETDPRKILTMLILTHIFMSGGSVNEINMEGFLADLDINYNDKDGSFGDIKEFLNQTLVKQKYLNVSFEGAAKKSVYEWGPRSVSTVSKKRILEFVCKIYSSDSNTVQPASWKQHHKEALDQDINSD